MSPALRYHEPLKCADVNGLSQVPGWFGQAKIQQLRSRRREHDVSGFQVPVHDTAAMCFIQRVRNLRPELPHLFHRNRAFFQPLGERLVLDAFHHQKIDPVLVTKVVRHTDVRMIQAGDDAVSIAWHAAKDMESSALSDSLLAASFVVGISWRSLLAAD